MGPGPFATLTNVQLPPQVSPPAFEVSGLSPTQVDGARVVAVAVLDDDGPTLGPGADELAQRHGIDLDAILDRDDLSAKPGALLALPVTGAECDTILFVGVGDGAPGSCRTAGATLARRARGCDVVASAVSAVGDDECTIAFIEGVVLASFRFGFREPTGTERPVTRVVLALCSAGEDVLVRARALAAAGWRSRLLATVPSNIKNPGWMAEQATEIGERAGLAVQVWDNERLVREGFGGVVAVGSASATPPCVVRLDHRPRGSRRAPHVVLVGKGITFDSGGLNIKPGDSMRTMKRDMTGSAVVLAAMVALAELGCPLRVTGLLCLAENAVGAAAMRPGDVLTQYGGRTTEVVNTDAEGRLVLADGLAYATANLDPDVVVDVATLTGAVKVALGLQTGGMYANRDALAGALLRAGESAGEPLWRLPLTAEYESELASTIADAINAPLEAQSISAALFLQHFVGNLPWAHLDLSSVGDSTDRGEWTAGPTGFGARLLVRWLTSTEPLEGIR